MRTYAAVLAGEELSYSAEVERCYGIRPQRVGTDVYTAAPEQLGALLPGPGTVAERYYLGGLRSRIPVNVDVRRRATTSSRPQRTRPIPVITPEHALKEQFLVRNRGALEETIKLVPTPEPLVSDGIAETGPSLVLEGDTPERLVGILRHQGLDYALEAARAVREARRPLRRVGLDAASMIHEDGASTEDAEAYVRRWSLVTPEQAAHTARFVTDLTWRAYVITHSAGRDLCHAWVDGDAARFVRLLTEQTRVRDLVSAVSSSA